jgi:hypothetical protein
VLPDNPADTSSDEIPLLSPAAYWPLSHHPENMVGQAGELNLIFLSKIFSED